MIHFENRNGSSSCEVGHYLSVNEKGKKDAAQPKMQKRIFYNLSRITHKKRTTKKNARRSLLLYHTRFRVLYMV